MQPLPHPEGNGTRPVSPARRPATPASGPPRPAAGGVSRLDRVTLQLGVAVAVVIAVCSYAVSATSLYALGVQAGYSWWQAAAVPVVADGPAIYGMFRIISRSRRGAKGAGYGWLLVICRHPGLDRRQRRPRPTGSGRPGHRRRHPPGRAGHARRLEGRRRRGHPPGRPGRRLEPARASSSRPASSRRPRPSDAATPPPTHDHAPATVSAQRRALPAGPRTGRHHHGRGAAAGRLCPAAAGRPALDGPHPGRGRRLWPQQRRQLPATPTPTGCGDTR